MEVIERLLASGADLHALNFQGGTSLRTAAEDGHVDVVRFFLERGVDPTTVDDFEMRPIEYARKQGHAEIVRILESAKRPEGEARERAESAPFAQLLPRRDDAIVNLMIAAKKRGRR